MVNIEQVVMNRLMYITNLIIHREYIVKLYNNIANILYNFISSDYRRGLEVCKSGGQMMEEGFDFNIVNVDDPLQLIYDTMLTISLSIHSFI